MTTAEELLNSLSMSNSENEGHIVIGLDRKITVPASLKRIAVQYDHNVETVTFDCPRYWDELDMSNTEEIAIYINYMRSDKFAGSYPVHNVIVDKEDHNIMHFDWTISLNVTEVNGPIVFLVCIKALNKDEDGNDIIHWNSELCKDMYVSEGMENEEIEELNYSDLVSELLTRMSTVEKISVKKDELEQRLENAISQASDSAYRADEAACRAEDSAYWADEAAYYAEDTAAYIEEKESSFRNDYANAIKGTAAGEFIRIDDVSPHEHDVKCQVHGTNLVKIDCDTIECDDEYEYYYGVEIDDEENVVSLVTYEYANDPDDPLDWFSLEHYFFINNSKLGLKVGKTYTANIGSISEFDPESYGWRIQYTDGSTEVLSQSNKATFTVEKEVEKIIFSIGKFIKVVSTLTEIQIEEGIVATAYTPYIKPNNVLINVCGTNVRPKSDGTCTVQSISPTMTISTNTPGVTVEVEYNRDTTKAMTSYIWTDEIKDEIAARIEDDVAEILVSLNSYAESLIGGDS